MRWWLGVLIVVLLAGCGASRPLPDGAARTAMTASPLVGPRWELLLIGTDERWQGERPAYFELLPEGNELRLSGSDGCNRLRGEATLGEGSLFTVAGLSGTRMACAGQPQAARLVDILSRAHRYLIDHDRLVLMGRDGRVLGGFRRQG